MIMPFIISSGAQAEIMPEHSICGVKLLNLTNVNSNFTFWNSTGRTVKVGTLLNRACIHFISAGTAVKVIHEKAPVVCA